MDWGIDFIHWLYYEDRVYFRNGNITVNSHLAQHNDVIGSIHLDPTLEGLPFATSDATTIWGSIELTKKEEFWKPCTVELSNFPQGGMSLWQMNQAKITFRLTAHVSCFLFLEHRSIAPKFTNYCRFAGKTDLVIVTLHGYSDPNTHLWINALNSQYPKIPPFSITDGDPHGIEIHLKNAYGKERFVGLNKYLATPTLIYFSSRQLSRNHIPLEEADTKMLLATIERLAQSDLVNITSIVNHCRVMLDDGFKYSIANDDIPLLLENIAEFSEFVAENSLEFDSNNSISRFELLFLFINIIF